MELSGVTYYVWAPVRSLQLGRCEKRKSWAELWSSRETTFALTAAGHERVPVQRESSAMPSDVAHHHQKVREGTLAGSEGGAKENERHKKSNPHMQTKRRRASSPFRAAGKGKSCVRPISLRDTWNRRGAGEPILSMALAIRPQWGGPSLADHAAGKCET